MDTISIAIAEDHPILLNGLAGLLEAVDNFKVIALAENGQVLLEKVAFNPPDIAIIDLEMPVLNGFKTIEFLSKEFPKVKSIVCSMHYNKVIAKNLILIGARGYLPKNADIDKVIETINEVHNDGFCFDENISKLVMDESFRLQLNKIEIDEIGLTERELEILKLVCTEKTNPLIAEELNISIDTVDFHRRNILKKTKLKSAVGLVKYAIDKGLA
ncbi:MAG: response regulator transcription factor [Bacteroidota bacterium]|nr:response regulator transcription factor [Bacteroidota bacterium]